MGSSWIAKSKCDNLSSSYMISSLYKLFTYCEELLSSKRRNELAKKTFSVLIDCLDFLDILTFQKHQLIFFSYALPRLRLLKEILCFLKPTRILPLWQVSGTCSFDRNLPPRSWFLKVMGASQHVHPKDKEK